MKQISAKALKEKLAEKSRLYLLDVREDWEHQDFNIGGTNIPMNEVMSNTAKLPQDIPVIVYCKKGIRSQLVIQRLEEKFGFENLYNLEGGMEAWKAKA